MIQPLCGALSSDTNVNKDRSVPIVGNKSTAKLFFVPSCVQHFLIDWLSEAIETENAKLQGSRRSHTVAVCARNALHYLKIF